jgi:hypothetical protein
MGEGQDRITTVSTWMTAFLWLFSTVIKNPYYLFYDVVRSPYLFASDMDGMRCVYVLQRTTSFRSNKTQFREYGTRN